MCQNEVCNIFQANNRSIDCYVFLIINFAGIADSKFCKCMPNYRSLLKKPFEKNQSQIYLIITHDQILKTS